MTLLGSQDLEEVGEKERHWVGVSGSGCLTRQVPGSRLGCPSPATQASPRGEGVSHQVTRKVASRRCGMVPAAACRKNRVCGCRRNVINPALGRAPAFTLALEATGRARSVPRWPGQNARPTSPRPTPFAVSQPGAGVLFLC